MLQLFCLFLQDEDKLHTPTYHKYLPFVDKEKQRRIQCMHFEIDRMLSLYADLLARALVIESLGIPNCDISWNYTQHHKPYLNGHDNWFFNLSHTRQAITVCTSDMGEVGVDIERSNLCELEIAERFFTPREVLYIKEDSSPENHRFSRVWTRKEAYIKWAGKGLHMPLNSFDTLSGVQANMILSFIAQPYVISVCSDFISSLDAITILSMAEFLNLIKNINCQSE